jgi:outer membrane receptor protein involved in Fe transport
VSGVFGEARLPLRNDLFSSIGVRIERISRAPLEGNPDPFSARPPFARDVVTSVNPRVALSWTLREAGPGSEGWTRLRMNAGTGIRPPDAFEIAFTDNPGLKPERSRSVDAGIEHALFGGRLVVDAGWFLNRYDDLIVTVGRAYRDASRYLTDNIANARASGIEISLAGRPHAAIRVRGGYTHLRTEVLEVDGGSGQAPPPFAPGDPLIRRPRHQGWLDAVITQGRVTAFARAGVRGGVLDVDPTLGAFGGTARAPGYVTADAGVSARVWGPVSFFGRAANLFDSEYEEALGYPAAGRTFTGGVRVAASR